MREALNCSALAAVGPDELEADDDPALVVGALEDVAVLVPESRSSFRAISLSSELKARRHTVVTAWLAHPLKAAASFRLHFSLFEVVRRTL